MPLVLPVARTRVPWRLPVEAARADELAAFLAAVDLAPAGAVLDVAAGSGEHALLAAVYGTRPVRAVEADPDRAHAARQAAATNGLPVVVEGHRFTAPGDDAGETVDAYLARTKLEPTVLRLGAGTDAEGLLAGARQLLHKLRPWLVVGSDRTAGGLLDRVHDLVALRYRLITEMDVPGSQRGYVLAPEAVETAFVRRLGAWSAALLTAATAARPDVPADAAAVVDAPVRVDEARTTT